MTQDVLPWLWIPITVWAAFAQTLRNAAQRHLIKELGTLGATLTRFLFGVPFAILWLLLVLGVTGESIPQPSAGFFLWALGAAVAQIAATALLLRVMADRNFAVGVAYSKTEVVQVAIFGLVFLGDSITPAAVFAILLATVGVVLLSPSAGGHPVRQFLLGWTSKTAVLGFASGGSFALAAVGFRGAALALPSSSFLVAAAFALAVAQTAQTLLLGGYLQARDSGLVVKVIGAWRVSLLAGFMGWASSAGWFTAMAIEPVAHVRTLGLIELFFTAIVSRRLFRETLRPAELAGMALVAVALGLIAWAGQV
jgi:drug/metabolite transporter (DMT)-like permease